MYYHVLLCTILIYPKKARIGGYVLLCTIMYYYVLLCTILIYPKKARIGGYVLLCTIMYYSNISQKS